MRFEVFFGLAVLLLAVDPERFTAIGHRLLSGLIPLAEQGLTLALIVAGIMFILGKI